MPSGDRVKKSPHPQGSSYDKQWQRRQLEREFEVYQRLPNIHPRVLRMFSYSDDDGLTLEYLSNGNLSSYLEKEKEIMLWQRLQWCIEAAEGVVLLHSLGIIHADIKPENMLLDERLGVRIIDMSGSSISGKSPLSLESTRFFLPRCRTDDMPCSVITDLFALGSSFYQIITGRQPYAELNDEEVEMRFGLKDFPSVNGIPFGHTIRRCWRCEIASAQIVLDSLIEERRHLPTNPDLSIQ